MKKYDFTERCKEIACDYEMKHSEYRRELYKRDVVITEYKYSSTELYAECHIDKQRLYRIRYDARYDQFEVEIYTLKDSVLYIRNH